VQRLQKEGGLTRVQAEGVMTVLAEVVDESIKSLDSGLVSKAEQEKVCLYVPMQSYAEKLSTPGGSHLPRSNATPKKSISQPSNPKSSYTKRTI
jgi:hypothetical protein